MCTTSASASARNRHHSSDCRHLRSAIRVLRTGQRPDSCDISKASQHQKPRAAALAARASSGSFTCHRSLPYAGAVPILPATWASGPRAH